MRSERSDASCLMMAVAAMIAILFVLRMLDGVVAAVAPHTEIRRLQRIEKKARRDSTMQTVKPPEKKK